jgi:Fe-S cluster assembly iron-binding protein IscA
LQSKDPKKKFLKIFVDSGGCSGFQYNFKMVEDLTENERYAPTSFLTPTLRIFEKDGA